MKLHSSTKQSQTLTESPPPWAEGSDLYLCKTRCQREIEATDPQIDQLVYELYGLTEEEIEIIEEATAE